METDIRTITKEVKNYYTQIAKAQSDNSLTTIQKNEYQDFLKKGMEAKGVSYRFEKYYDAPKRVIFDFQSLYVDEIGLINDVRPTGAFPFTISVDDNISILYDPRNIEKLDLHEKDRLNNNEFSNIQKGSNYQFAGKVFGCNYYYMPPERFDISVIGMVSTPKNSNCFIATACYGSCNSPEVLVLRKYRDDKLLKTFYGRIFVKFYYSVSPFLASLILKSDFLKKSIRQYFLEPIIIKLNSKQSIKN